ncbi:DUF4214 domain-containing protein [Methylobacterium isbiliense]|jgi:hypothetical protein|uniref:Nucleotide-diphospho-sugar transferase domain-containing protein n=1 Tax=Methylobacterium isbiliense TaxID=315478 RepID=A0ABQ4SRX9_9HYPH|nr:DUF4214 domain-containing protein [Methylobacterium isbiliense]MDN3627921.1 DUF4214 domain-containing protein [Methylobacterium isbiliense]GJE04583.1 hypothetical protein GMJLKIPL_6547 [Methylobacterium isbiliense]
MKIVFIQTCDVQRYMRMQEITRKTIASYCERNNFMYHSVLGLIRGGQPWHAALNRIPIISGYINDKYDGWIVYLDADAYIADMSFDLESYLSDKSDYALIGAPSGAQPPRWWDINNGVFALNARHPVAIEMVYRWREKLDVVPDSILRSEDCWGAVIDDQAIMHEAIQETLGAEQSLLHDSDTFNWNANFIRQVIRANSDFESRIKILADAVDNVLQNNNNPNNKDNIRTTNHEIITAFYRVLLGREPDDHGLQNAIAKLDSGTSFEDELRACVTSDECRQALPRLWRSR